MQLDPRKIPKKHLIIYSVLGISGSIYLAWSIWGPRPPAPGQTITATPVKAIEAMPQKVITSKVRVIADPVRATEKLKIDPPFVNEELQTAVAVPQTRYGATSTTFLNTSTGQSRVVIRAAPAPWFRLERGNSIGAGVGINRDGRYATIDYQRDILSVKGIVLAGKVGVTSYTDKTDARAEVRAEYRW